MKKLFLTALACGSFALYAQTVSTFENIISNPDSSYNGKDLEAGYVSGAAHFWNSYNTNWGSWSGFAFSSEADTSTPGWTNQYSCIAGSGANNSLAFGIVYSYAGVSFTESAAGDSILGLSINNSTYAYRSMESGDAYAKKFGGVSGNDSDWFYVEFTGYLNGSNTQSVKHYLADFRNSDNSKDYIQKDWSWVDLSALGKIDELSISFGSSDVDSTWGFINTPTYACIDSLVYMNSSPNFRPIASDDDFISIYDEDQDNAYTVLLNDKDPDDPLSGANITILDQFNQGTTLLMLDGRIQLARNLNAYGYDTVVYELRDRHNLRDTARAVVLINERPEAEDDVLTLKVNDTVYVDVATNDWDDNRNAWTLSVNKQGDLGMAGFTGDSLWYQSTQTAGWDTIRYQIEDEYGLIDSAELRINIDIETGIQTIERIALKVYPNPAKDELYVENLHGSQVVEVINLSGTVVLRGTVETGIPLSIAELNPGIYFLGRESQLSRDWVKFVVR